ncbi:Transcriptional regulatory protein LiaR [compost metagenome]
MTIINVLLIEDDPFWQENIAELLRLHEDINVVRTISSKEEALRADLCHVDVVLLDISLSKNELDGIDVARQYSAQGYQNIIMLTSYNEDHIIAEAFEYGAINYITKSSCMDIPDFIRDTFFDRIRLHSDVSKTMIREYRTERKLRILTPTEREIYDLKKRGMNKVQISQVLYKSVETIKKQIRSIKQKLTV